MLHHRMEAYDALGIVPPTLRTQWKTNYRRHVLQSLILQQNLANLHDLLAAAGIPYIALKGAFLAFHVYPKPELRPLRDLDLLVPQSRAMDFFCLLLEHGYTRLNSHLGDPQAYLESSHQLPPLRAPAHNSIVEIHTSVFHRSEKRSGVRDPSGDRLFWQRSITRTLAGRSICFPMPEDMLVHLVEHAIYGHQFDNGPLFLSDIAFLLGRHRINWPLFWKLSKDAHCERGAALSIALARYYWPEVTALNDAEGPTVPTAIIRAAAGALLSNGHNRKRDKRLSLARLQTGVFQRSAHAWSRLFPGRNAIALAFPVRTTSPLLPYFYMKRLYRLATRHLIAQRNKATEKYSNEAADRLFTINSWLESNNND